MYISPTQATPREAGPLKLPGWTHARNPAVALLAACHDRRSADPAAPDLGSVLGYLIAGLMSSGRPAMRLVTDVEQIANVASARRK